MIQNRNSFRHKLRTFRRLGLIAFILVVTGTVIVLLGRMEDSVSGFGVVSGLREYELKSQVGSKITAIHRKIGDRVNKGELLLELDDRNFQEELLRLGNAVSELEMEIEVKIWELEVLRHDPLPKEYRHTGIELEESRERMAKSLYEREVYKQLMEKKVVSTFEYQKRELEYIKNEAIFKKLEEDYAKLKSGLAEKILSKVQTGIELLKRRLASRKSELEMLRKHAGDYQFTAPENGVISFIPNRLGLYVEPGESLVTLAAEGPLKFTVYVDEKDIWKVREELPARIASSQYNYFEHGYFRGTVYAIDELPVARGARNCYAVRILLEPGTRQLRLGSTGEAEIIIGRDYIFRVLSGISR